MAFGQGETVLTPIEQAVAYSTFANGGTRYAPQVASEIVDPATGKVHQEDRPEGHRARGDLAGQLQRHAPGLRGRDLEQERDGVRGLPGLPGLVEPGRQDRHRIEPGRALEPNSWFVAFGPNPNPQYVVLAVIDQGGYGAQAAAPLVRNIFNYILANPEINDGEDADAEQSGHPDDADDQPAGRDADDDHDDHHAEVGVDGRLQHDDLHHSGRRLSVP